MTVNPLILIGLVAALAALILLARGRAPRRIGMGDGRTADGAVSRKRRRSDRASPPQKDHSRHDPNWRTDTPAAPQRAQAASLHDRLAELRDRAVRDGKPPTAEQALGLLAGSAEARAAAPGALRLARLAIWAWIGLWGFSAVMVVIGIATGEAEEDAIVALGFLIIPLAIGLAGLRAIRRFRARIEKRMAKGGR